jgi:diadenosine tetraphosphate (Ap4A) HIT family hydrolase
MVTEQQGQCCFCELDSETIWLETESRWAIWDGFPISKGHTLIVPKFHIPSFHDFESETRLKDLGAE